MSRVRTLLSVGLPLVGMGVAVRVFMGIGADPGEMVAQIPAKAHLAAAGLFVADLLLRGGRLSLLARGLGHPLSLIRGCGVQLLGEAAAAVTPSKSGSDPMRISAMRAHGIPLAAGAAAVVGEMIVEAVAVLLVIVVVGISLPELRLLVSAGLLHPAGSLALTAGVLLAGDRLRRPGSPSGRRLWTPRRRRVLRRFSLRLLRDLGALRRLPRTSIAILLAASGARVGVRLAVLPVLVLPEAPGTPLPLLLVWPLVFLYALSLLPPPGGGGTIELGYVAALSPSLAPDLLAASLLWWRFYTFGLGAFLGGILLSIQAAAAMLRVRSAPIQARTRRVA